MATFEVLSVSLPPEPDPALLGAYIDHPLPGMEGDTYTLHIVGWVLGRDSPARAVEVVYQPEPDRVRPGPELVIRETPVRGDRVDVAAAFPQVPPGVDCHFEPLVGVIGNTPEFELRLRAVLEDGTRAQIGALRVRHSPLRTSLEPRFDPISVTCLGRSGSTWVMGMLAAHPEIVAYRRFPYESSPAKYWMQMLKVLAEPSNIVQSAHPDTFHGNRWWVGNNLYYDDAIAGRPAHNDWFGRRYVESLATFCQQSIDDWYTTLAATQDQPRARYFAEKHLWPNFIPVLMRELYPRAKEIFLVRDFRDMALSILAFDRKRGFPGFGRPEDVSDEEYIRTVLKPAALSIANGWRTRGSQSHLLRYEDLVLHPEETLASLLEYLELDPSQAAIEQMLGSGSAQTPDVAHHRTTSDLRASIGRWRRERDDAFRSFCQEVFADELADFGYLEAEVAS